MLILLILMSCVAIILSMQQVAEMHILDRLMVAVLGMIGLFVALFVQVGVILPI